VTAGSLPLHVECDMAIRAWRVGRLFLSACTTVRSRDAVAPLTRGITRIGAILWVDNGGLSGYDLGGMLCERAARAEPLDEGRDPLIPFLPVNWEELARTMGALRKLRKDKSPGQPAGNPAAASRRRRSPVRLRKGVVSTHSPSIPRV
jgi:hypothetical protein